MTDNAVNRGAPRRYRVPRARGATAVMFTAMMVALLGLIGMALDLGMLYNRKAELHGLAAAVALAAAHELNGTATGVTNALAKAGTTANAWKYQYDQQAIAWSSAALSFAPTSTGPWTDAASAQGTPDGLLFVKVDTSALDAALGTVNLSFVRILSPSLVSVTTAERAVAGRSSIQITPLAICALSNTAAAARANPGPPAIAAELVEYGFRRGVAYNLMQLNPSAASAENFVIDPIDPPGVFGTAANTSASLVEPFVCTGLLAMPRVSGGSITVGRPFPLASLYRQLNSRFDDYTGAVCNPSTAPPDSNVKSYVYTAIPWMSAAPGAQSAQSTTTNPVGKLWTYADPFPAVAGTTAAMYGPLWAGARAVPFSSYTPGSPEPAAGYTPYATSAWAALYKPGQPSATGSYPAGVATPYTAVSGANFQAPSASHKSTARRRVLNVPLLSCPVGPGALGTATVLGIGKFLMTVPATTTSIYAEFTGVAQEQSLGGQVELYQ